MSTSLLRGIAALVVAGAMLVWLSCGGGNPPLKSITILPSKVSVAGTPTIIYTAIGHYKRTQTTQDITSQVVWQSSVPSIADFSDPTHPNYLTPSGTGCGTNVGIKAVVYKDPKDPSSPAIFGSANVNVQCATGSGLDFGLSAAPTSVTVSAGSTATYTINVVVNSGSPTVDLQFVGGLPSAGSTASLNPSSVTGTAFSTLTISTAPGTAPGTYHPKITGTDGSGALTLVLTLIVN
jgi:hypothetical protein